MCISLAISWAINDNIFASTCQMCRWKSVNKTWIKMIQMRWTSWCWFAHKNLMVCGCIYVCVFRELCARNSRSLHCNCEIVLYKGIVGRGRFWLAHSNIHTHTEFYLAVRLPLWFVECVTGQFKRCAHSVDERASKRVCVVVLNHCCACLVR